MKIMLILLICTSLSVPALSENGKLRKLYSTHRLIGSATYYTKESCQREETSGVLTASGRPYNEAALTCALPFHPVEQSKWGKKYRVMNVENGLAILVEHWDYGPGKKARSRGVIIDLTPAAFKALGVDLRRGRVRVRVSVERVKG